MSDAIIGVTETSAVGLDSIAAYVQQTLIQSVQFRPTVFQLPVAMGDKSVTVPSFPAPSVSTKAENTAVDAQAITWVGTQMLLDQHKVVQYLVEDIAMAQAKPELIGPMLDAAARKLAEDMDDSIYTALKAASATAPDHRIAYANSGSTDTLGQADILEARRLLNVQNLPQEDRFFAINPTQEKEILSIDTFVEADKYGAREPLLNGELGRLFGFRIIMSNLVDSKEAVAYHRSACAFGWQIQPKVESFRDVAYLADRLSISHLYGVKLLDDTRVVKIGTAS